MATWAAAGCAARAIMGHPAVQGKLRSPLPQPSAAPAVLPVADVVADVDVLRELATAAAI